MREPGEGLMHGVRLTAPGSQSPHGDRGDSQRTIMECTSPAEALAWLCVVVENIRLRTAWGLHVANPPTLDITSHARQRHADVERLIEAVRRDLPDVMVRDDAAPDGDQSQVALNDRFPALSPPPAPRGTSAPPRLPEQGERDEEREDEHAPDASRGEGDALTREEIDMLLGRPATRDTHDPADRTTTWENV